MGWWRTRAGERGSSALTIGGLSATAARVNCCTICSCCHRVAASCSRRCAMYQLQLEHELLSRNGLHSDLGLTSAEVTALLDQDGRVVRRRAAVQTACLGMFDTNSQTSAQPRLDLVDRIPQGTRTVLHMCARRAQPMHPCTPSDHPSSPRAVV